MTIGFALRVQRDKIKMLEQKSRTDICEAAVNEVAITPELSACTERTPHSSFYYYRTARPQESVTSRRSAGRKEIFSLQYWIKNHMGL